MEKALFILGIVILVVSSISGIFSGSVWIFIFSVAGGITAAIICWALSEILGNQANIKNQLDKIYNIYYKLTEKKICSKCNESYDNDMSYCPHCGHHHD